MKQAEETKKNKGGRPSKLTPQVAINVFMLARKGLTDAEIAQVIGTTEQTINNWKKSKEFFESLKEAKAEADLIVERSLFENAVGYEHREDKVFCNAKGVVTVVPTVKHYQPDTTAAIFWLKNRQPEQWKDKRVLGGEGLDGEIVIRVEKSEVNAGNLQAPRFAIPDLQ